MEHRYLPGHLPLHASGVRQARGYRQEINMRSWRLERLSRRQARQGHLELALVSCASKPHPTAELTLRDCFFAASVPAPRRRFEESAPRISVPRSELTIMAPRSQPAITSVSDRRGPRLEDSELLSTIPRGFPQPSQARSASSSANSSRGRSRGGVPPGSRDGSARPTSSTPLPVSQDGSANSSSDDGEPWNMSSYAVT